MSKGNRAKPSGINAETSKKQDAKYDNEAEQQAITWMSEVLRDPSLKGVVGRNNVQARLKTGVDLCELMNTLQAGIIKKVHPAGSNSFKQMENVGNFLKAAETYGCIREDLFQTCYLTDNMNMMSVITTIFAVGRVAQKNGWQGPVLGPKEAEANPREFTEEQMMDGRIRGI